MEKLDRLVRKVEGLLELESATHVVLNLKHLTFIRPAPLAALTTAVFNAHQRGILSRTSRYIAPEDRNVAQYLDRMDFTRLLIGADVETFERKTPNGFRPVRRFADEDQLEDIVHSLTNAATEAADISDQARMTVLTAIQEIAENVLEHARSPVGGFAMAQSYPKLREFEVAVADAGVGILTSLRRNPQYSGVVGEAEAINLALAMGVTSTGDDGKGVGLAAVRQLLEANQGALLIRSGIAAVEDGRRTVSHDDRPRLCGTLVTIRMRTDRAIDHEAFRKRDEAGLAA